MPTIAPICSFVCLWVTASGCQNFLEADSGILSYNSAVDGPSCQWTLPISYARCSALTMRFDDIDMESDDRRCKGELTIPTGDGLTRSCSMREGACYLLYDESVFGEHGQAARSLLDDKDLRCGRNPIIYYKTGPASGEVKVERFQASDSNEHISFRLSYSYQYCVTDSGKRVQGAKFSSSAAPEASCKGLTVAVIILSLLSACLLAFIGYLRCRSPSLYELQRSNPSHNGNATATEENKCLPSQDGGTVRNDDSQNIGNILYHMEQDHATATDRQESAYAFAV